MSNEQDCVGTSSSFTSGVSSSKRARTSAVWNVFTLEPRPNASGQMENKAICKFCKKALSYSSASGNGHLKRHAEKCSQTHVSSGDGTQSVLAPNTVGDNISCFRYSHQNMREGMAKWIVSSELPFTQAEDKRLEKFMRRYVQPAFKLVPRNTCKSDIIKLFQQVKKDLIAQYSCFKGIISITSDCWTGCNRLGYICITSHYIDDSWVLQKRIIAFRELEYPHTAFAIFTAMMSVFREYEIQDKIFSITFDNASANNAAIDMFINNLTPARGFGSQFFHLRCVCHVVNLVVQDGLGLIQVHIEKIRDAIQYIASHGSRRQEFNATLAPYGLQPRRFMLDVKTRWNSTFLMLKSCVNYSDAITNYYNHKLGDVRISPADWNMAFTFMNFLKTFYDVTLSCSRVYSSTSSCVLNHLHDISYIFATYRDIDEFRMVCAVMEEKFKKYWRNIPKLFVYAAAMDPRINLSGSVALVNETAKNLNVPFEFDDSYWEQSLNDIYAQYQNTTGVNTQIVYTCNEPVADTPSWKILSNVRTQMGTSHGALHELGKYVSTDYGNLFTLEEKRNFDVLQWWKANERVFPVLSTMARDLLTPPVSTVASESAFSAGNRVLDERRSRLSPEVLDCLICLKDWEDAEDRIQNINEDIEAENDYYNLDGN